MRFNGEKAKRLLEWSWFHAGFVQSPKNNISRRKGKHKAIIGIDTLELIEMRLAGKQVSPYRKTSKHFPLRGDLKCEACLKPMTSAFSTGKNKKQYGNYVCRQSKCRLNSVHINYELVHTQFVHLLKSITPTSHAIEQTRKALSNVWDKEWEELEKQRKAWRQEIVSLEQNIQKLIDKLIETDQKSVVKAVQERIDDYAQRKEMLTHRLDQFKVVKGNMEEVFERVMGVLSNPADLWLKADLNMKKTIQRVIFPNGLIFSKQDGDFRKPEKAQLFLVIQDRSTKKPQMARPAGFEPATPGSGNQCSIP